MAAVTDGRDRAQLVLIGALALAVSLVVIALVLNSAIYTHNLASRYQSPAESPSTFARDATLGAGDALDHANRNRAEHGLTAILDNYSHGLDNMENSTGRYGSANGRSVRLEHLPGSEVEGVWIGDLEAGGSTFEDANESLVNWYVARDVRVRQYRMVVNNSSVPDITRSDAEDITEDPTLGLGFVVEVDDGSQVWRMAPYDDDGQVNLMVHRDGSSTWTVCTGGNQARIDFTDGLVNNQPCRALGFFDDLSGTYHVRYWYGGLAVGQYELFADRVVDDETAEAGPLTDELDTINYGNHCGDGIDANGDESTFHPATSSQYPRISPTIYESRLVVAFEGPDTTHETVRRVAPDVAGQDRQAPRVTRFEVQETDSDADDGEFTVTWDTDDPNGDLVDVTLEFDPSGSSAVTYSLSGSGSQSFDVTDDSQYVISIRASDGTHSRSAVQTHDDDGDDTGCPP